MIHNPLNSIGKNLNAYYGNEQYFDSHEYYDLYNVYDKSIPKQSFDDENSNSNIFYRYFCCCYW